LEYITDAVPSFTYDLGTQNPGNYSYDSVGNMISDASRTLTVQYTYSNRPKFINFANGRTLKMRYNPFGYRFFSGSSNQDGDVFLYSSQGQLVAKYSISGNTLKLNYLPIYEGSRRIGIVEPSGVSWLDCPELMLCGLVAIDPCMLMVEGQPKPPCRKDSSLKADRKYELVDHLGNIRVVIANQRIPVDTNGDSLVDYYKPLVKSIHDYYPFGWEKQLTTVEPYPFTYQGQLFDRDLGWQYYRYRNYDPMIARFYQVEPLIDSFPQWGGYVFGHNSIIYGIEIEGLELFIIHGTLQYEEGHTFSAEAIKEFMRIAGNTVVDEGFRWQEAKDLLNKEEDRGDAAIRLAAHVLLKRQELLINEMISEDEPITLLGYSHGGNVAIQAARILGELGYKVQLITVSTPAYTDIDDPENPATVQSITGHLHIVHELDKVVNVAWGSKSYESAYQDVYDEMCVLSYPYQEYVLTEDQMPVGNDVGKYVRAHTELPYRRELVDLLKRIPDNALQDNPSTGSFTN